MSNVFSFTGNVGKDAEVRVTPSGQSVLNVTVGSAVGFGDKQQTLWIRVALWGKRAEGQLSTYLKKGQQVFISGELSIREYQATDGSTKTSLELNANILDLVGGKREGQGSQFDHQPQYAAPAQNSGGPQTDNFADFDDDIPFMSLNHMIKNHLI